MTSSSGVGRSPAGRRPHLDPSELTAWLRALPPRERIRAAEEASDEARALVGHFAEIRRAAVVEAHAQGEDVGVSPQKVRDAARRDRELLRAALEVLTRPGVAAVRRDQLAQGLAARAPMYAVAQRVDIGIRHLDTTTITGDEHELLMAAHRRALAILGRQEAR
ncbi:hypothetical protein GCM10012275_61640 [Longimycelium tulufanense]|uniref:Uncharacterized protein n=1 Tax=Longimycelium tulufanense TaxID=907463 RepID=A0A8J3FX29_9PSEU|nr:hypothetical protein [Longimycelium tulufanense]GGM82809.1 hypothetical protein GCM10012275_61640 [Longimycelium tulufanense]